MALNADELFIPGGGSVLIGDVGATAPDDTTTAWGDDWTDLGYTSENGVTITPGMDITDVTAWQSRYPVRRIVTAETMEIAFELLQWNEDTISLAFGGGTWSGGVYTPPAAGTLSEYALGIEGVDGDNIERWIITRAIVTNVGGIQLQRVGPAMLPITMSLLAVADESPFTVIRNELVSA